MIQPKFPQRHNNRTLEQKSTNYFRNHLPASWNPNTIDYDYGIDLSVEIAEENRYRGLEFIVQLKSSAVSDMSGEFERQTLAVMNYNYLWDNLRVAMLVKYVEEEDAAYWILFKDIPTPNQIQETFTIRIPRENKLSTINWNEIQQYVSEVTKRKLNANRPPK